MVALLQKPRCTRGCRRLPRSRSEIARAGARLFAAQPRINLLPVQIEVRKQGTTKAPDDGLLVKKGDVLQFALASQFFDTDDNFESLITWQQRQLKGDGTYTEWANISAQATGTKFEHTTAAGGIFQIKAIITNGGEHEYKRKKDAPHGTNSRGAYNEAVLKKDKAEFVGVVDDQWQISLRDNAKGFLGSTAYAQAGHIDIYTGGPDTTGANKCNIFVYHRCNAVGLTVPMKTYFSLRKLSNISVPPLANDWANSGYAIPSWVFLGNGSMPQPGMVVIRMGTAGFSGHMGILNYDGSWINAGKNDVNQSIHLSTDYQPAVFRKHSP